MKSKIFVVAGSALALMLLAVASTAGVLAQTPTAGSGNGAGPGAGNGAAVGNPNRGAGMGAGMGLGMQMQMGGSQNSLISVAARELGKTNAELVTALGGTKSIAQVAGEHNVAVGSIIDAFLAPRIENLDAAVAAGRLTREQADQMVTTMRTHVTEQINEVWTAQGSGTGAGTGFVDADGDGVCDNMGAGGTGTGMGVGSGHMGQGGMMGQGRGPRR